VTFEVAGALDNAQLSVAAMAQLPAGLALVRAYEIQHEVLARRCARGERLVGTKLGFTSRAKMAQMGVSEIIVGQLTDAMAVAAGGRVELARFIHPRIEPEVAFRLAVDVDLDDPGCDIQGCVDAVAPALEIIDSRYRDFRFALADVVADNTSAAGFVVGRWQQLPARPVDLPVWDVELVVDETVVEVGSSADILGHPGQALEALVPMARKYGFALTAGQVILAGAATAAAAFGPATVQARIAGLGTVTVTGTP
jgi:2-oxo-3-hexenedioate decarboxylase